MEMKQSKNPASDYLVLRRCSAVLIFASFIITSLGMSDTAVKSLEPSPFITSRRDQLQTSLLPSVSNHLSGSPLYSTSVTELYDSDGRSPLLSTSILKVHTASATLELTSVLSPNSLADDVVHLQTGEISEVKFLTSLLMQETSSPVNSVIATPSVPLSTKIDNSVLLTTSPSADRSGRLTSTAADKFPLYNLSSYSQSPLSLATEKSDVLGQSAFVFSSILKQSHTEKVLQSSTVEITTFNTLQLQPTTVAETMVSGTPPSSQAFIGSASTEKMDTYILGSTDPGSQFSTVEMPSNDVDMSLLQPSSSLQLQTSIELSTDFVDVVGTTTGINQTLLNTVVNTASMSSINFEDQLPVGTGKTIQQTSSLGFEITTYVDTGIKSMMSSRSSSQDVMRATSEISISEILDHTLDRSSISQLPQTRMLVKTPVELSMDHAAVSSTTVSVLSAATYSETFFTLEPDVSSSVLEMTRTIGEPASSSLFQMLSVISVTDLGQSFIQESLTPVELTKLTTPEPIIICFTTILTLPNLMATSQPGDAIYTSQTLDMMSWSGKDSVLESLYEVSTPSFTLIDHHYSTETYTPEQGLSSEMRELQLSSQPMISTSDANFATELFSNPGEDILPNSLFQTSKWAISSADNLASTVGHSYSTMQLFDSSQFSSLTKGVSVLNHSQTESHTGTKILIHLTSLNLEDIGVTTNPTVDLSIVTGVIQPNASISIESTLAPSSGWPERVNETGQPNLQTSASIPQKSTSVTSEKLHNLSDVMPTSYIDNFSIYSTVNVAFQEETAIETESTHSMPITVSELTNSLDVHNIRKRAALDLGTSSSQTQTEQLQNQLMLSTLDPSLSSSVPNYMFIPDVTKLVRSSESNLFSTSAVIHPSEINIKISLPSVTLSQQFQSVASTPELHDIDISTDIISQPLLLPGTLYSSQETSSVTGSLKSSYETSDIPGLWYSSFGNSDALKLLYSSFETSVPNLSQRSHKTLNFPEPLYSSYQTLNNQVIFESVSIDMGSATKLSKTKFPASSIDSTAISGITPSMMFLSETSILESQGMSSGQGFLRSTSIVVTDVPDSLNPFLNTTEMEISVNITVSSVNTTASEELDEYSLYVTTTIPPTVFETPAMMMLNSSNLLERSSIGDDYATMTSVTSTPVNFTGATLPPTFTDTPSVMMLNSINLLERSSIGDDYATMTSVTSTPVNFTGATLPPTFTETPSIMMLNSSNVLQRSSIGDDYATMTSVTSTPVNFTGATLPPTFTETPSIMMLNSSNLLQRSSIGDDYATMTSVTSTPVNFTGATLPPTFTETPSIMMLNSSNLLQRSSIGNDYATMTSVTSTPVNFTGTTLPPAFTETPSIMMLNNSNLLERSSIGDNGMLISMTSIPINILTTSTSQHQNETFTYVTCTTIYPSAHLESSIHTDTVSQMEMTLIQSDAINIHSDVTATSSEMGFGDISLTPAEGYQTIIESFTEYVNSLETTEPFTDFAMEASESASATLFETGVSDIPDVGTSYVASTIEENFGTITLEPSTFETVLTTSNLFTTLMSSTPFIPTPPSQEISDVEVMSNTLGSTYIFTLSESYLNLPSSMDVESGLGKLSHSLGYTPNTLKTDVLSISATISSPPEQSETSSVYSSIHPGSSVTPHTSSKPPVDVITTGTTKKPYITLDTSFVTQSSWLQLVIEVPTSVDTKSSNFILDIEGRLATAYIQARNKEQGSSRRRRAVTVDGITVQQIDISRANSNSESLSIVYYIVEGGERIQSSESAATMQQLSTEALSIALGYPVGSQVAVYEQSSSSTSKIWIAAVVLGIFAFIFLVCCCICWCCRPRPRDGNFDPETLKFLQFKQKYPYHSYYASKRREAATSPTGLDNSHRQFIEDERSVKTSDYHTDDDDSVRIRGKRGPPAPPKTPSRAKTPISRQDDVVSESDSFVSTTEDELKMSSSAFSQRRLASKLSKHEQKKEPKEVMFSHVAGQQTMQNKPKTKDELIKQKDAEAEWKQAQAEISAILEPEVVKGQRQTTFVAPHKRKRKSQDKRHKQKSSHASSSVDNDTEQEGMYSSLPDVHYARPLAAQNENSEMEMSSLGQTRKRMHALLDEAFSLVNLPPTGRNTVRPLQSTADHSSMKDYKKASKARERRRHRLSSTDTHTGSETDDSVFKSRHPFVKHQVTTPADHEMKDGFTQTKVDSGKVVIVPVTQLSKDTGGLVWSIYDAEDQMSRLSPTKEPATMPGGLDTSPPVTIKSSTGALLTLPHLSTLPTSELTSTSGPAVPLKLFKKTMTPRYDEAETSFQLTHPSRSYQDKHRLSNGSIQNRVLTPGKRPVTDMLATLEKEKRIGKPVDDSFDELNVTAIIKGSETPQPLMKVIREELERLAKLRPRTFEDEDVL